MHSSTLHKLAYWPYMHELQYVQDLHANTGKFIDMQQFICFPQQK